MTVDVVEAARWLRAGAVGAFPTETLYGLAADATDVHAVDRLLTIKGREAGKPVAVLVADVVMLESLVEGIEPAARRLARHFWPGPLTLVFTARPGVADGLTGGTGTIGARVSSCPMAQRLVSEVGRPITAPSANPAGLPPPRRLAEVQAYFGASLDFYLDGGELPGEPASTVVDVRREMQILRPGAVPESKIRQVLEQG